MGGDDELTAVKAGGVLQKAGQLQLEPGRQTVFRLVQQVEPALLDLPGEVKECALPVGTARDILHHPVPHIVGAGLALGLHHLAQAVIVLQRAHLKTGVPGIRIFLQQFLSPVLDVLIHISEIQQAVEHIVTGDDPAVLKLRRPEGPCRLRLAEIQIGLKKGAPVEHSPATQLQLLRHQIEHRGLAAAVPAAQDGDGLKGQRRDLSGQKDAEGVVAAVTGPFVLAVTCQEAGLCPLPRQGEPPQIKHVFPLLFPSYRRSSPKNRTFTVRAPHKLRGPLSYFLLFKYSSMAFAACLPAPMARMTVAAPVAASPPAKTPSTEVCPASSAATQPFRVRSRPGVPP